MHRSVGLEIRLEMWVKFCSIQVEEVASWTKWARARLRLYGGIRLAKRPGAKVEFQGIVDFQKCQSWKPSLNLVVCYSSFRA